MDPHLIENPKAPIPSYEEQREHIRAVKRFDLVALILGAIGLVALTYAIGTLLNPFVLIVGLYIVLTPYREYHAARTMMWAGGLIFFFWFFWTTAGVLVPFIIAAVIAYLFNPFVTYLHVSKKVPRILSSIVIVGVLMGIFILLGFLFIPSLVDQTGSFITRLSTYVSNHVSQLDEKYIKRLLVRGGIPSRTADQLVTGQVTPQIRAMIGEIPSVILSLIEQLPRIVERLLNLIIVPFAAVYLLKDWKKMGVAFLDLFPAKTRARRELMLENIDRVLYGYIRGQLTMAIIVGSLGALTFWILGVPYYGLLGVVIAVSDLIPIVGMLFSVIIVEIVIFLTMQLSPGVIFSGVAVIGCLHLLESYILGPKIVGEGIGLPPVIMILSLILFGYFLGFIGLLIAVPATAVLMMFLGEYRKLQVETVE